VDSNVLRSGEKGVHRCDEKEVLHLGDREGSYPGSVVRPAGDVEQQEVVGFDDEEEKVVVVEGLESRSRIHQRRSGIGYDNQLNRKGRKHVKTEVDQLEVEGGVVGKVVQSWGKESHNVVAGTTFPAEHLDKSVGGS
jgi:hypothetical protein